VFDQTTAVLVALAAGLAPNLNTVALPAFLDKRLSVTRTPDASLVILVITLIGRDILRVVVDGTAMQAALGVTKMFPEGHRRWWRRQATDGRYPRHCVLGHGVSAGAIGDRQGGGGITVPEGNSQCGDVGSDIRHGFPASNAVGIVEGCREQRGRALARVRLTAGETGGGGVGEGGAVLRQWPRGLLHLL
jgi:hypothetical protein